MNPIEASNKADSHLHSTFSVTLCNTTSQRLNSDYSPFPQTFLKKDSFTRKRNNDPSHKKRKQKIEFSCLRWVHTFACAFLFGWDSLFSFIFINCMCFSGLLWLQCSEIYFWFCSNRLLSRKHFGIPIHHHMKISSLIPVLQSFPSCLHILLSCVTP